MARLRQAPLHFESFRDRREMLGEIFHPLVFANSERFLHAQIAPQSVLQQTPSVQ